MITEIKNTRRLLRKLRVPKDAVVAFKEDIDPVTGQRVFPRKLIIEVPIEYGEDWMEKCKKIWRCWL